ncbi:MAG: DUF2961 domain-containing protein [Defluviitaleaceae bacterium]|nr:DUF2961 domain-containing protein [Defluviitaleaceae bacterium]
MERNSLTRSVTPENPGGLKGRAGMENGGAKGRAFGTVEAGETCALFDITGSGVINRFWMTVSDRSPSMLRSLKIEMFWDDSEKPAVSAPLGDFFCAGLGKTAPFESFLFSNPEGRSFNCFAQMPFLSAARITLTNESEKRINTYYDIAYTLKELDKDNTLYFHCFWNRENKTRLAGDYCVLGRVAGAGRFLGASFGVAADKIYGNSWFGEGEAKFYIDGDGEFPTLCGTGTEDFIGSAWGQGRFSNMTQGSPIADGESGEFSFYRFHLHDPIFFHRDIRVTIQNMGGAMRDDLLAIMGRGAACKIVSRDAGGSFVKLYQTDFTLTADSPDGWYNFYREDDYSSAAYFYLDRPFSELPALPGAAERVAGAPGM